jgi:two-component system, sensor histidine kinase YesM
MRERFGWMIDRVKYMKIHHKLLLSYFVLIILPLVLITFLSYRSVADVVQKQTKHSAVQVFEHALFFLSSKINHIETTSEIITINNQLNTILSRTLKPESYRIPNQIADFKILTRFLSALQQDGISRVRLYVQDGLIYSDENVNLFNLASARSLEEDISEHSGRLMWLPSTYFQDGSGEPEVVSAVKILRNPNNFQEDAAVLRIDILKETIIEIVQGADITRTGYVYIENSQGQVIANSKETSAPLREAVNHFIREGSVQSWGTANIMGDSLIVGYSDIDGTDWRIVSIIPMKEIMSSSDQLRIKMELIMIIIGTGTYVLAAYFSNYIGRLFRKLIQRMKRVQNGELTTINFHYSKNEIGELTENFNYMINRINELAEEKYQSGLEVKNAELKALQTQINPHFLYNTLDLINWMGIKSNNRDISELVQSLAKFYRLSLNNGKEEVSVRDEIAHVETYVNIQNRRFDNCIRLVVEMEDSVYDCLTLKILLQPIVENAILHGILQKDQKRGTISITGKMKNNEISITVEDDGVGISPQRLEELRENRTIGSREGGYGLKNINERIKLYYGDGFGLEFESAIGHGTKVTLRIPVTQSPPSERR